MVQNEQIFDRGCEVGTSDDFPGKSRVCSSWRSLVYKADRAEMQPHDLAVLRAVVVCCLMARIYEYTVHEFPVRAVDLSTSPAWSRRNPRSVVAYK